MEIKARFSQAFSFLVQFLTLLKNNLSGTIIFVLCLIIAFEAKKISDYITAANIANNALVLKAGELAKIEIELGRLRANLGNGTTDTYQPPEGGTSITVTENEKNKKRVAELDAQIANLEKDKAKNAAAIEALKKERDELKKKAIEVNIVQTWWGFTFKPGLGALYSNKLLPEIDVKIFFISRYSVKIGVTPQFGAIGFSRHIDDLVPFFRFQNLEIQAVGGYGFDGDKRWGFGVRCNL